MVNLNKLDFIEAIKTLGIEDSQVCIHSSIKSFGGRLERGIESIVDAFLSQNCTIMVPTFSDAYEAKPISRYMPERNGAGDYSFFLDREYLTIEPFDMASKELTIEEMGLFTKYVLEHENSVRGNHPLNSFTALGANAVKLVKGQTCQDVYAPLKQLCADDGYVLLMGVGLEAATVIHYAEQVAGRTPFIRWSYDKERNVIPVSEGGCSEGFGHFENVLKAYSRCVKVGKSEWVCYKAADIVDVCSKAILRNPKITHCGDSGCDRCNDAVCGGPVINDLFWTEGC